MGPTILFTHLKIILLQCFQFSVFSNNKLNPNGPKGMKSKTDLANSKSFVRPHVCHHCGVSGHICPNCIKLYPHKQLSKRSQVSSQGPISLFGDLLKALSFLTQFQKNSNSSMSFSRHTRTCAFSSSQPKTRAVWVRKEPKT